MESNREGNEVDVSERGQQVYELEDAIVSAVTSCALPLEGERAKELQEGVNLRDTFESGQTAQLTSLAELAAAASTIRCMEKTQQESTEQNVTEHHYYITLEDPNGSGNYALIPVDETNTEEKMDQMDCWVKGQNANKDAQQRYDLNVKEKTRDDDESRKNEYENKENMSGYEIFLTAERDDFNKVPSVRFVSPNPPSKPEFGGFNPRSNVPFYRPPTPHPRIIFPETNTNTPTISEGTNEGFHKFAKRLQMTSTPWSHESTSSSDQMTSSGSIYATQTNLVGLNLNSSGDEVHNNNNSSSDGVPRAPNNTPNTDASLSSSSTDFGLFKGSFQNIRFIRTKTCPKRESHNDKERRRRNRISSATAALRELVPGLTERTDKATVLECVAKYIYHMKEHVGDEFDKDFIGKCSNS